MHIENVYILLYLIHIYFYISISMLGAISKQISNKCSFGN